jgi:putative ABC transport system substrate-binding protein
MSGLVASLAHPGGNVTGLTGSAGVEENGKRLELLKEAFPTVSRVAVLHPRDPFTQIERPWREVEQTAARALGLTLQYYVAKEPNELASAFSAMTKSRVEALYLTDAIFPGDLPRRIVELASQNRLPTVYSDRDWTTRLGGLMSYDTDPVALGRRLPVYVDKILKGAKPADLPVEEPTKFELVINLKTAKALGLTIPPRCWRERMRS